MDDRCNGCGRRDLATTPYRCEWPDGRVSMERHCEYCRWTWHRQLKALGAKLTEVEPLPPSDGTIDTAPAPISPPRPIRHDV